MHPEALVTVGILKLSDQIVIVFMSVRNQITEDLCRRKRKEPVHGGAVLRIA